MAQFLNNVDAFVTPDQLKDSYYVRVVVEPAEGLDLHRLRGFLPGLGRFELFDGNYLVRLEVDCLGDTAEGALTHIFDDFILIHSAVLL